MNQEPELFIYEPRRFRLSAQRAAEMIIHHDANCHDFRVNGAHETPSIRSIRSRLNALKLEPSDGEAFLLQESIREAVEAAVNGRYGVGAVLASSKNGKSDIIQRARNERYKGGKYEFTGHAEMRLVDQSTPYLQSPGNHKDDVACVNLCPCPGCFGHMIDTHVPTTIIGSIDPQVGAAFLKNEKLRYAVGRPREQVIADRNLEYRFPDIQDSKLRGELMTLSWEVFHTTRSQVHKKAHGGELQE